jgi:hypothetical protein
MAHLSITPPCPRCGAREADRKYLVLVYLGRLNDQLLLAVYCESCGLTGPSRVVDGTWENAPPWEAFFGRYPQTRAWWLRELERCIVEGYLS